MDDQADYAYDFPTLDFQKKSTEEELVERLAKAACVADGMADNMIERVAKAIGEEMLKPSENYEGPLEPMVPAKKLARAAIKAMRCATPIMLDCGDDLFFDADGEPLSIDVWESMIDAALNEDGNE